MNTKISLARQLINTMLAAGSEANDILEHFKASDHIIDSRKKDNTYSIMMRDGSVVFMTRGDPNEISSMEAPSVLSVLSEGYPFEGILKKHIDEHSNDR